MRVRPIGRFDYHVRCGRFDPQVSRLDLPCTTIGRWCTTRAGKQNNSYQLHWVGENTISGSIEFAILNGPILCQITVTGYTRHRTFAMINQRLTVSSARSPRVRYVLGS